MPDFLTRWFHLICPSDWLGLSIWRLESHGNFCGGRLSGYIFGGLLATPFFRSGEKPYRLTVYCCTTIPRRHSFPVTVIKHFDYYSALFLDSPVLFFPSFFRIWGTSAALGGVGGNLGTCPFKNAIWSTLNQNSPFDSILKRFFEGITIFCSH